MKATITLGEICTIEKGKIGIQAATPGEYPLVTTAETRNSHNEYHFEGEAVCIPLVSATGHGHASIKRLHFQSGKFCVGNILAVCIPKKSKKTSAKFLYLYLSLFKDSILVPLMQGSANVSLKIKDLEKVEVPNIDIGEQLYIAELMNKLQIHQDDLNKELHKQQTYLSQLRQSILQEAVQGKLTSPSPLERGLGGEVEPASKLLERTKAEKQQLTAAGKLKKEKELPPITDNEIPFELPKGWVWCRLGELCNSIVPNRDKPKTFSGGTRWVTLPDFDEKEVHLKIKDEIIGLSQDEILTYNARVIPINNVVMSCVGRFGLVAVTEEKIIPNQQIHGFLIPKNIFPKYIAYVIKANKNYYEDLAQATTIAYLNKSNCESLILGLPPLSEQQRIIAKVQQLLQMVNQLEQQVQQSQAQAQQLLQAVLKEAFSSPAEALAKDRVKEIGMRKMNW